MTINRESSFLDRLDLKNRLNQIGKQITFLRSIIGAIFLVAITSCYEKVSAQIEEPVYHWSDEQIAELEYSWTETNVIRNEFMEQKQQMEAAERMFREAKISAEKKKEVKRSMEEIRKVINESLEELRQIREDQEAIFAQIVCEMPDDEEDVSAAEESPQIIQFDEACQLPEIKIGRLIQDVPQDILNVISKFNPDKAEILPAVNVFWNDQLKVIYGVSSKGTNGSYKGRIEGVDENNMPIYNPKSEQYIVSMPPMPECMGTAAKLHMLTIMAHEIFGHAIDDRNRNGEFTQDNIDLNDAIDKLKSGQFSEGEFEQVLVRITNRVLKSEYYAFKEEHRFINWVINSNDPELAPFKEDAIRVFMKDEMHLLYLEAVKTGDWTEFESFIFENYTKSPLISMCKDKLEKPR